MNGELAGGVLFSFHELSSHFRTGHLENQKVSISSISNYSKDLFLAFSTYSCVLRHWMSVISFLYENQTVIRVWEIFVFSKLVQLIEHDTCYLLSRNARQKTAKNANFFVFIFWETDKAWRNYVCRNMVVFDLFYKFAEDTVSLPRHTKNDKNQVFVFRDFCIFAIWVHDQTKFIECIWDMSQVIKH